MHPGRGAIQFPKELSNRSSRQRNKAELLEAFVLQEIDGKGKIFAYDARARSDEIME